MRALVFHRPGRVEVNDVPDPRIESEDDVILRVTATAICGSDLHIYNGFIPQKNDMVLGHEFMGVIEEVGRGVRELKKGDRVVVPFPIACGHCFFCQDSLPGHCENSNPEKYGPEGALLDQKGGGLFGYTDLYGGHSGGQAEYVRVPYANFGPRTVPENFRDEQVLFLTDIFPTGYSGIDWAGVKGGETVAVFGCGPVGLMAQKCAWIRGAKRVIGVDILNYRLAAAQRTAQAETINAETIDPVKAIREAKRKLTDKVANVWHMEVGSIKALKTAISAVRRGGHISVLGVYGIPYDSFPVGQIFDKGIHLSFGQAPVQKYIDDLIRYLQEDKIRLDDIISHRLLLDEAPRGYEIFNEKREDCVKVVLTP